MRTRFLYRSRLAQTTAVQRAKASAVSYTGNQNNRSQSTIGRLGYNGNIPAPHLLNLHSTHAGECAPISQVRASTLNGGLG